MYESSLDDFYMITYYVLGTKTFCDFKGRVASLGEECVSSKCSITSCASTFILSY